MPKDFLPSAFSQMHLSSPHRYVLLRMLGRGKFGRVFLAKRCHDSSLLAIKVIRDVEHTGKFELGAARSIRHPFIIEYYSTFVAKQRFHVCMEYLPGGNLYERMRALRRIPLHEAKLYVCEISLALRALHDRAIVYRDLKPENVMIAADGHIKLADFGLASDVGSCVSLCGTADYLAPEMVARKRYGPPVDWWALGVVFFEMVFGRTPFYAADFERMKEKIVRHDVVVPDIAHDDSNVAELIQRLLDKDPERRAGFEDVMRHPFFADLSVAELLGRRVKPEYVPGARGLGEVGCRAGQRESFQAAEVVVEARGGDSDRLAVLSGVFLQKI
jgi:protein kinase A